MLTPEKLSDYEFSRINEIYEKLNIDICSDIIRRIEKEGNLTATSKKQLKTLLSTNGKEIFNEALLNSAKLNSEVKNELATIYEDMAKSDLVGYKELYDYKDKKLVLSASQLQILNAGVDATAKELANFTNSIAFNSQKLYVDTVDTAYQKVITGAFDYNTAIKDAYNELASSGIKLQDSIGRNVNLDVAVRRNVLYGIKSTADTMNRDIEEDLGCDGYEVTAHIGARPTHAFAHGKQYAKTSEKASKFKVGLWSDVEGLWSEFGCRHTYFGIVLGVSKPLYTKNELSDMNDKKVTLNGETVPYYEATQTQRRIERDIRESKRTIATLDKAGIDSTKEKLKLNSQYKEYNKFSKETGITKQSERLFVTKSTVIA
jgi:hypothetical protein